MKLIRIIFFLVFLCSISFNSSAQMDTAHIKTSAICETCKKIIENDLSFEKGVKSSKLDVPTGMLTVIYNPAKTDLDKIRKAVSKSGYDADSVQADVKAYKHLPDCCKRPEQHNE